MGRRKSLEDFVQKVNFSGGRKDTKSISRDTDSKIKPFQENQGVRACTPSRALKSRKSRCWEGKPHTAGGGQAVTESDRVGWVPSAVAGSVAFSQRERFWGDISGLQLAGRL